jgi:hypothetical protein
MKKYLAIAIFAGGIVAANGCHSNGGVKTPSTDTSTVMGPAPDNNSANNPSLADTGFEKNRTRPITDTAKKK